MLFKFKISNLKYVFTILIFLVLTESKSQTIIGHFPALKGQLVYLNIYNGLNSEIIDSAFVSEFGDLKLSYSEKQHNIGFISTKDKNNYLLIFEKDNIELYSESIISNDQIIILKGLENKIFSSYAIDHQKRENILMVSSYLQNLYKSDSLFSNHIKFVKRLEEEIIQINKEDENNLNNFSAHNYLSWYLMTRKLINSVSSIARFRPNEITNTIKTLRALDYADHRMYNSGLLKDAIESHYWLIENMGIPLTSVFKEMNKSTSIILTNLNTNKDRYNEIVSFIFDYFEKHSLYQASEYLAVNALEQNSIHLNSKLSSKLEIYRKLKKGNLAPEIYFTGELRRNGLIKNNPTKLSEIKSDYKVLIFGASWCNSCSEEMSQLLLLYSKWQSKGIEIVFISMDTDSAIFKSYSSVMPFFSYCEFNKWDTHAVLDYHITSSPTILLLDKNNKILQRPKWIKSIDSWVDSVLR